VDLEEIGRIRRPELLADSLAAEERALIQGMQGAALDERILRLWCAKEAASKCLGIGLQGQPSGFVIVSADAACEMLVVHHELGTVETRVMRHQDTIIAVAGQDLAGLEIPA
jgi:phosphopantetheinyl transferase